MKRSLVSFPGWSLACLGLALIPLLTLESLNPQTRLIGMALTALIAGLIAAQVMRAGSRVRLGAITFSVGALALYAFLLLPGTPLPGYMLERTGSWLLGLLVLLVVQVSLQQGARASQWEDGLLAAGVLLGLVACLAVALWNGQWDAAVGVGAPPIGYRLPGVLVGHPNVIAGYLNLLLPLVVVRLLTPRRWFARVVLLLVLALFLFTEYFASSRGGWLGGGAGIAVSLGLLAWPWVRRTFTAQWQGNRSRTAGVVAALLLAIVGSGVGAYSLLARQASRTYHVPVASARTEIWGPAVQIIQQSPILGHGVGAFVVRFAQATHIPPGFSTNHAHNLVLQILAETGAVGLLLALAAGVLGVWGIWPSLRRAFGQVDPPLAAYLGAFAALLVHHSVDYLFNVASYLMAVMTLIALTIMHPHARRQMALAGRFVGAAALAAAVAVVGLQAWTVRGMPDYPSGLEAHRRSDFSAATDLLCRSARDHTDASLFGFQCALAAASEASSTGDASLLATALEAQRTAFASDPYWPIHQANLAGLEWASGLPDQAIDDLKAAAGSAPRHALLAVNLGWMLEQQGREAEALEAYRRALAYDTLLPETPFFAATHVRRQALSTFVPARAATESSLLVAQAREAISAGDAGSALPLLDQAVAANPRSASALAWRAQALADAGRTEDAWRDIQTALFIDSDSWESIALGAVIADQAGRTQDAIALGRRLHATLEAGSSSASYYAELYRRPTLAPDMVPQLIRAVPTAAMLSALELAATSYEQQGEEALALAARAWMLKE